ncbi:3,4-dihydroxyphenylacetate 2,3-dioxygenase [Acetobacter musti]|uniref:3,4-dihydroxyphenylacetate 2,3-dioxygenase n=1 Tax=Acetobacter musti TaxID=864732 RepID=A0ABX0JQC5_9PROT|nr:VOC family protein [Acetobacter musti]NHN85304.1 3,4-dihydroxyphenylacetate 2,3-dioxygenase [Acetobacter musti]
MSIPSVVKNPPFNITRSSHVRYFVTDLETSLRFYTEILGLVVSDQDSDTAYLRGIEEACHHSVVLMRRRDTPAAECVGMRVASEDDLHRAQEHIIAAGGTATFVERPYQGPTLLTTFGEGTPPVELCSSMPVLPRLLNNFPAQKGGRALRLDHYQCVIPDVGATAGKFMALGFRPSKYTTHVDTGRLLSIFLTRKNNPHDLVLAQGAGPRLHHVAFIVSDLQAMFRACDIAANLGYGRHVEYGPGRHGPPNGIFTYFRDPDGNRIEFGLPPMQFMDPEDQPNVWDSTDGVSLVPWGDGPPQRWREEMTLFDGITPAGGTIARWTSQR